MSDRRRRSMVGARRLAMGVCVAVVATGCGSSGTGDPSGSAGPFDEPAPGEPAVFADGVVSSQDYEWRIAFEADGRTAYFPRSEGFFPQSRQATIMVTRWESGGWAAPEVAAFSGTYPDIDPFISSDGKALFFSSIRPVGGQDRSDTDLWVVRRTDDGDWSEPEHLGEAVNSDRDELYASVDAQGNLYFGSDRSGSWDIWRSAAGPDGSYGPAENLGPPVNVSTWDFNPFISADGTLLVFTALNRAGGAGAGDIWFSRLVDGEWTEPAGVGPLVNTPGDEYHPSFSPSLDRLFYITGGNLYQVATSALNLPPMS